MISIEEIVETVHYKYGITKAQLLVNILLNLANNLLYE